MLRLLADLGDPQRAFRAVHVVGSNGKTSTTLMTAALLETAGLRTGATISPHIRDWSERIQVGGSNADLERALARVRPHAAGATQFEVLIAASFAEFAAAGVEVAVVEAGLGGRLDATNVLDAEVVVLTNVALEHIDVLGNTREKIAKEKLGVVSRGALVVLGEPEWEGPARAAGAREVVVATGSNRALAAAAAAGFLGRSVDPRGADSVVVPGRLEQRAERPLEIWDGAHNAAGVAYLLAQLPDRRFTIVASILADKDAGEMLKELAAVAEMIVVTRSQNPRALPAEDLAQLARSSFPHVEVEPEPAAAVARARALAGPDGAVLVTGSLYLLAELSLDA